MTDHALRSTLTATPDGVTLRVKVVPGAKRTRLVGILDDRVKITVAAPPEAGQANRAVCKLLADLLNLPRRDVTVTTGHSQPRKTIELVGLSLCDATDCLRRLLQSN